MYHLNSAGTTTEDSELTGWLRENGADEDTISRVKRNFCGTHGIPLLYIMMSVYYVPGNLGTGDTLLCKSQIVLSS